MIEPTTMRPKIDYSIATRAFDHFITMLSVVLVVLLAACETPLMPEETASSSAGEGGITLSKHGSPDVRRDLTAVRRATARFHKLAVAQATGYELVPGLDHCFTNQPAGDMGYHYIDVGSLDLALEVTHPEAMVYAPGPNGQLMLGAVEYIVPAADWDAEHESPPSMLGHDLHLNEPLGVYVLHAWIWRHNPEGIFEDWNPTVSCD